MGEKSVTATLFGFGEKLGKSRGVEVRVLGFMANLCLGKILDLGL